MAVLQICDLPSSIINWFTYSFAASTIIMKTTSAKGTSGDHRKLTHCFCLWYTNVTNFPSVGLYIRRTDARRRTFAVDCDILQPPGLGLDILYLEYCFIFGSYVLKNWGKPDFSKKKERYQSFNF